MLSEELKVNLDKLVSSLAGKISRWRESSELKALDSNDEFVKYQKDGMMVKF